MQEVDPEASTLIINRMSCSLIGERKTVHLTPETRAARFYGRLETIESFNCNFGLNEDYRDDFQQAGLIFSGKDGDGNVRIAEIPDHPFYLATLFLPQLAKRADEPHPLIAAFVLACRDFNQT